MDDEQEDLTDEEVEEADAAQDEEVEQDQEADRRVILNRFKQMRIKYMAKSTLWPFLSFSELKLCNQVKKLNYGEYASFMKVVETRKSSFAAKANSALSSIVPILPYIIIGLVIIVAIFAIISLIAPWLAGLFGNASSPFGVNGENFYGVRYVYRDAEQAKTDLWQGYAQAFNDTIKNFKDENVTLNLTMPTDGNGEIDFSIFNDPTGNVQYAEEYNLVLKIAQIVYLNDSGEESADGKELSEILAGIKYFGLDADLVNEIATSLAEDIEANETLYTVKSTDTGEGDGGGESSGSGTTIDVSDTLQPVFENYLLQEYVTGLQFEADSPTRTDLLYVKDYILEDDEEATLEDIPQKDYVAMIYLPRSNLKISSVSYSIYGVAGANFNIALQQDGGIVASKNESNFGVYQEKGESSEFDTYHFEIENINVVAVTLSSFQQTFLTTEKSLMAVLQDLKKADEGTAIYGKYLKVSNEVNTHFWNTESEAPSGPEAETEPKYFTVNFQDYLSVLMNNSDRTAYSFTEFETVVA